MKMSDAGPTMRRLIPAETHLKRAAAMQSAITAWNVAGLEAIWGAIGRQWTMTAELFGVTPGEMDQIASYDKGALRRMATGGVPLFLFRLDSEKGVEAIRSCNLHTMRNALLDTYHPRDVMEDCTTRIYKQERELSTKITAWNSAGLDSIFMWIDHGNSLEDNPFGISSEMMARLALGDRPSIRGLNELGIPLFRFRIGRHKLLIAPQEPNTALLLDLMLESFIGKTKVK